MATDRYTQGCERSNDPTRDTEASGDTPASDHIPVTALIAEEYTLRFA
ncbi:hypothetical protein [Haloplanus salinus]|jgi:hypothetical protein|nr:hypothetical protein [Haloplanus salinus]